MDFQDSSDPPPLPAHPEWVEIVVPWGEPAPKVIQGHMDPLGPRDNPQEHPVCPVYLVKWARPARSGPDRGSRSVRQAPERQARQEMPPLPALPAHGDRLARLARMVPPGQRAQLDRMVALAQRARRRV